MFIRLAIRNVKKNYNRTMLAICGMIVAAALLTGGGAFAQLYPERGYFGYRRGAGGDVLVFPNLLTFDERHANDAAVGWRLNRDRDNLASLSTRAPDLRGRLEPSGPAPEPFRLDELPPALAEAGDGLYPYLGLPVTVAYFDASTGETHERVATLRGRMAALDLERYDMADCVTDGRYLGEADAGGLHAVINAPPLFYQMLQSEAATLAGLRTGDRISVSVPAVRGVIDGELVYDFGASRQYELDIVGAVSMQTDVEIMRDENGFTVYSQPGKPVSGPVFWDFAELYITRETWESIYADASGGLPIYTGRMGVIVRDASRVKAITVELDAALNGTAITVADLAAAQQAHRSQIVVPRDLTVLINGLTYLIAGLLLAANMHVLISQRQAEIGVMKAIGVGSRDIFILTMLEIIGFSVIGSLIGFVAVSGALWLFGYWSSGVVVAEALSATLHSFLRVVAFTLGATLIFGVAPALRATRATTVSALRTE